MQGTCWTIEDKYLTYWTRSFNDTTLSINPFHFRIFLVSGNQIGDEGCKALAELLKTNTSLTQLSFLVIRHCQYMLFFIFTLLSQGTKLEMKGARHLPNYWRQIPHLLNLIFHWYDIVNKRFIRFHIFKYGQSDWRRRRKSHPWGTQNKHLTNSTWSFSDTTYQHYYPFTLSFLSQAIGLKMTFLDK